MNILKSTILFLFCFCLTDLSYSQSQVMLGWQDFDSPNNNFTITFVPNFPTNPNYGINQWLINKDYDGQGIYPNTPSQDSTVGGIGQISSPNNNYLHIRDYSKTVYNDCYDPLFASERWAVMPSGVCTQGYSAVLFNFWWVAQGAPGDYGEVYYSVSGPTGPWVLCSKIDAGPCGDPTKYCNTDKWKFARVENIDFINKDNLSFAFKWTNDGNNTNDVIPFAIDDIIIIGEYDENNPVADITAISISPSPVCHEDVINSNLAFLFSLDDSLCDGSYEIELSDSNCNFNNSIVLAGFTTGTLTPGLWNVAGTILIPSFIAPADCYCFRINRTSPPLITGIANTGCFQVIDTCSESSEIPLTPAVLQDPYYDPNNPANPVGLPLDQQYICDYSVIDVKFFSYGAYNPGNNYVLELSDSTGSFASPQTIGGPMPSTQTYDPAIYPLISPGSISGTIPDSVDGKKLGESCDYYIRVVSTDPVGVAAVWGPFCIKDCDVKTNDGKDISVCITDGCNADVSKSVSIGTINTVDFNYIVSTTTNVIDITSTDTIIWDSEACAYVDSTIIDSVLEDEYTIDISSSGSWGLGWKWTVNGDLQTPADSINPSFTYSCPGNYIVGLESMDPCVEMVEKEIILGNMSSDFSYIVNGSVVAFTSNATSLPEHEVTYSWEFGDGWTSGIPNPTHEYSSCFGSFTVTLTLIAKNCCSTSHTEEVLAGDLVADFDVSVGGNIATFTDKSLGLLNETSNGQSWVWDFGDGESKIIWGRVDTIFDASTCTLDSAMLQHTIDDDGTGAFTTIDTLAIGDTIIGDVSHQYDACGVYEVSLTCVDSGGICIKVPYKINSFDSTIFYGSCNKFKVQILSPGDPPNYPPAMTIISEGELGWILNTESDSLELCVPSFTLYQAMGYSLGMYYMRIIATDANDNVLPFDTTNLLGSIIRFSVRGISGDVMDFNIIDQNGNIADTICANADGIGFLINSPAIPSSNYSVQFIYENNLYAYFLWNTGQYPIPAFNPLCCFNLSTWPTGLYAVTFQEVEKAFEPFSTEEYCVGPLSGPQYFYIKGPPDVTINGPTTVCVGDTVTYTSNFVDTLRYCVDNSVVFDSVFVSGTYYSWDFIDNFNIGNVVEMANNQITIAWTDYGPASIDLTALGTCGSSSSSTTVIVTPKSDLAFNNDTTICEGESITLTAINQSWLAYNDFAWIIECDTVREISVTSDNDDELTLTPDTEVTVIVWVDNGGCPDWDTVTIKVVEIPDLETSDSKICIGDTTQLNAFATEGTSYLWTPSTGLNNDTINNPIAFPQTTTDYIVTVGYDSICPDIVDTATVTVNIPIVEAGSDTTIFLGDQVLLDATGGVTYVWSPTTGLDNPNVANPLATPEFTTTYIVTITDANGCVDIDSLTIEVISFQFDPEVPDAFTPDGSGPSSNDKLYVHDVLGREGDALETITFKIFNRWGELIFEANEVSQIVYPNGGWDGTNMNNGKPMEVGVYVWLLEAQTVKNEKIGPISGNVTLLR